MICATVRGDAAIHEELARIMAALGAVLADPDPIQTIIADTVRAQMDQELDPEGTPWPPLSPAYQMHKAQVAPGVPMGVLDGVIKEQANLRGTAVQAGDTLIVSYGVDPDAIQHALWFSEGDAVRPPRPFYGLNATSEAELVRHFATLIVI